MLVYRSGDEKIQVPEAMGVPRADQLQGTVYESLIELSGRVCYDGETELLTSEGWVKLSELVEGTAVATFNRKTKSLEFQLPTEYIRKLHRGVMYEVDNTKVSIRVTADHELWVRDYTKDLWKLEQAKEMFGKRYRVQRHAVYLGAAPDILEFPGREYTQCLANNCGAYGTRSAVTEGMIVTNVRAWAKFLGWYFSEGYVNSIEGSGRVISIYQLPGNNLQEIISVSKDIIGRVPSTYTDKRNGVVRVMIRNSVLGDYLLQFGHNSRTKRLPREVFTWSMELRALLLDRLMRGDGTVVACGSRVYTTVSEQLADDVQQLILMSGRVGTISRTTGGLIRVRESQHDLHCVNKNEQQDSLTQAHEHVFCVSVPNRILVTRRKSKVVLCGNCYDSLGRGRNSQEYHKHILEVGHLSVLEHANLCFEVDEDYAHFLFGRPGIYLTGRIPPEPMDSMLSRKLGVQAKIRFVANFRAIYEWSKWSNWPSIFSVQRDTLGSIQSTVAPYAPIIFGEGKYAVAPNGAYGFKIVEPRTDDERWVTMYLTGSRGFSHELVRHGDFTAISQRSTRYVNENNGAYCYHPLLKELMLKDRALAEEIENVQHREKLVYQQIFEALKEAHGVKQARGAARGVLANALQTEVIFSASVAQWRRMIAMRTSEAADGEIREVFLKVKDIIYSLYGETKND